MTQKKVLFEPCEEAKAVAEQFAKEEALLSDASLQCATLCLVLRELKQSCVAYSVCHISGRYDVAE